MTRLSSGQISLAALRMAGVTVVAAARGWATAGKDDSQVLLAAEQDWAKAAVDGDADRMAG